MKNDLQWKNVIFIAVNLEMLATLYFTGLQQMRVFQFSESSLLISMAFIVK